MCIAVGGMGQETNAFSALRTRLADLDVRRGGELLAATGRAPAGVVLAGA